MAVEIASSATSRPAELAADAIVHGIGLCAAVAGAAGLIVLAAINRDGLQIVTVTAYSVGLVTMLACSTIYNMAERSRHRELLRRIDHAAIFVMIAGTYTPFTTLALHGDFAVAMTVFVWAMAAFGVALKLSVPSQRLGNLSMGLYLTFGWIGLIIMWPLLGAVGVQILILLGLGGAIYSLGTIVYAFDRLPFQRAIWHACVVLAAAVHYAAIASLVHG